MDSNNVKCVTQNNRFEKKIYICRVEMLSGGLTMIVQFAELVNVEAVGPVVADVVDDALH